MVVGDRHTSDSETFTRTEEVSSARPPGHRVANLSGIKLNGAHAGKAQTDCELNTDRSSSNNCNLIGGSVSHRMLTFGTCVDATMIAHLAALRCRIVTART